MRLGCRFRKWSMRVRAGILHFLAPNLLPELNRLVWLTDANLDLHSAPIPYNPVTFKLAYDNAKHFDPLIRLGKSNPTDRLASLVQICINHEKNRPKQEGEGGEIK